MTDVEQLNAAADAATCWTLNLEARCLARDVEQLNGAPRTMRDAGQWRT
jgi:hypothetical protein